MDFRQMTYFLAVADAGSFSRASRAINVTQSALSQQIKGLEDDIGTKLFERSPSGVFLTQSGKIFRQYAQEISSLSERARYEALVNEDKIEGAVSLALSNTMADLILPTLLRRMDIECPRVQLKIVEGPSTQTIELLENCRIDLGIVPDHNMPGSIEFVQCMHKRLQFFGSREKFDVPVSSDRCIDLKDAAKFPLAVFSKRPSIRQTIEDAAAERGIRMEFKVESSSASIVRSYVIGGLACAIIPDILFQNAVLESRFFALDVVNPSIERSYGVGSPKARPPHRPARIVQEMLIEILGSNSD